MSQSTLMFFKQGLQRILRTTETDAVGRGRIFTTTSSRGRGLPPQPCSYSIWPFGTFLPAVPLLSSYLHRTGGGGGRLRRLDRVPPFNQDVNQVFQNHPGGMWAVVPPPLHPSLPPSLPFLLPANVLLTICFMPGTDFVNYLSLH